MSGIGHKRSKLTEVPKELLELRDSCMLFAGHKVTEGYGYIYLSKDNQMARAAADSGCVAWRLRY